MHDFLTTFAAALLAAVLAVGGAAVQFRMQDRGRRREEGRAFVRQLQPETVDVVTDLDLLIRRLRSPALTGHVVGEQRDPREIVEQEWEGDLLRRLRRLSFGHPDPDVRAAAEMVEDEMWNLVTAAVVSDDPDRPAFMRRSKEDRQRVVQAIEPPMVILRRAVHAAPYRDLPKSSTYTGERLPPRIVRALTEKDTQAGEAG